MKMPGPRVARMVMTSAWSSAFHIQLAFISGRAQSVLLIPPPHIGKCWARDALVAMPVTRPGQRKLKAGEDSLTHWLSGPTLVCLPTVHGAAVGWTHTIQTTVMTSGLFSLSAPKPPASGRWSGKALITSVQKPFSVLTHYITKWSPDPRPGMQSLLKLAVVNP